MLQKLGLIKYKSKPYFEDTYHLNPLYYINDPEITSFLNTNKTEKPKNQRSVSYQKRSTPLLNVYISPTKDLEKPKPDKTLLHNIKKFISESAKKVQHRNYPLTFLQIDHDLDDNPIDTNKLLSSTSTRIYKPLTNNKKNVIKPYSLLNKNIIEFLKKYEENQEMSRNFLFIEQEAKNMNEEIKKQNIINDCIINKINLLKNEIDNNINSNTENDKDLTKNIFDGQNSKQNRKIINNDILSLKESIIKLKNKISKMNREQKSINLMLFKEKMESDLKKEDINKMNKLKENIKQEIKEKKDEINSIEDKNSKLLREININLSPKNKII